MSLLPPGPSLFFRSSSRSPSALLPLSFPLHVRYTSATRSYAFSRPAYASTSLPPALLTSPSTEALPPSPSTPNPPSPPPNLSPAPTPTQAARRAPAFTSPRPAVAISPTTPRSSSTRTGSTPTISIPPIPPPVPIPASVVPNALPQPSARPVVTRPLTVPRVRRVCIGNTCRDHPPAWIPTTIPAMAGPGLPMADVHRCPGTPRAPTRLAISLTRAISHTLRRPLLLPAP